jgi:hypothetical protein
MDSLGALLPLPAAHPVLTAILEYCERYRIIVDLLLACATCGSITEASAACSVTPCPTVLILTDWIIRLKEGNVSTSFDVPDNFIRKHIVTLAYAATDIYVSLRGEFSSSNYHGLQAWPKQFLSRIIVTEFPIPPISFTRCRRERDLPQYAR